MTFQPSPKQTLFLWRMISAETEELREPMQSKAKPKLTPKEREPLVKEGFLTKEKRGGAQHLVLTDKAWHWAATHGDVQISKSQEAAPVLQGLLRRLIPILQEHQIPLAELFQDKDARVEAATERAIPPRTGRSTDDFDAAEPLEATPVPKVAQVEPTLLAERILETTRAILNGGPSQRVRLADLRRSLADVSRETLDAVLIQLQNEKQIALFRDDNTAALTEEDHRAALRVGDAPRHLIYLYG